MNKNLTIAAALALSGCSLWSNEIKPVVDAGIDCAKQEAAVATNGKSVTQITVDVISSLDEALQSALDGDFAGALDKAASALFAKYGEPIVACVMHDLEPKTADSAKKAGLPNPISVVIAKHGWTFAPSK